jgi:hypothetical protein
MRSIFNFICPRPIERRFLANFIEFNFGFMYSGDVNRTVSTRIKLANYRASVLNFIDIHRVVSEILADELKDSMQCFSCLLNICTSCKERGYIQVYP